MSQYAEILKQAMKEQGVTAAELSRRTGIGKSSLSQYLSGVNEPLKERKAAIAEALGISEDYFRQKTESPNLPVCTAAKLMGKSPQFVRAGLQKGIFPWGYAVQINSRWSYYISPVQFCKHTGVSIQEET